MENGNSNARTRPSKPRPFPKVCVCTLMVMALFPSRYWPENDEEAQSVPAGISLEALHQLASQRAEARRKRAALADDTNEVDHIREHKKKRKKKSRQAKVQETDDSKVILSDAEEQMKELKLSSDCETDFLKADSKSSTKRKKKMRGTDIGSPLKDSQSMVADNAGSEWIDEMEVSTSLKKKKHRKRKHDHPDIDAEPTICDDHPEHETQFNDAGIVVDVGEFVQSEQESGGVSLQSEGEDASREDIVDTQAIENVDVTTVSLMPLGHAAQMTREKKTVQRQLPQWINEADIISDDIIEQSRSLDDFSLAERVIRNLERIHIDKLFPVQVSVIPELLSYQSGPLLTSSWGLPPRDVCVCAPTGCGKTLCYVIPIISALLNRAVCQVRAIVVVPSQELAVQVQKVFDQLAHGTPVHIGVLSGSMSFEKERAMLFDSSTYPACSYLDIVIATPGRLVEHLDKNSFCTLRHVRYLVIDEADKLLAHHFNQWLPKILSAVEADKKGNKIREGQTSLTSLRNTLLNQCSTSERLQLMFEDHEYSKMTRQFKASPSPLSVAAPTSPLQKLLFSATMTQNPEHLAALNLHQPKLFTVASALQSKGGGDRDTAFTLPKQLEQCTVRCSLEHKPLVLLHLLTSEERREDVTRVLCFTNSKESTHRLCLLLDTFKLVSVGEISSSLGQGKRKMILNNFKNGKIQVLVCSDQMARGMDVEGISCVVNYDPPRQYQTYLHRAGRTARAGQRGVVFTLLSREEVHSFNTMLRKVGAVKKLEDVTVLPTDLKPFLSQYKQALESLKLQLSTKL